MVAQKISRGWIFGLSAVLLLFTGCANSPGNSATSWFPWGRKAPLTDRERQRQDRERVSGRLQDPSNLHLKYGLWREQEGDMTNARKSYQDALKANPKSLEAKLGLARMDQLAGRPADAEAAFQEALKSHPGNPQAVEALGQFYASQQHWNKAIPLLKEAVEAAPGEASYRYHLAVAMAESGDVNGAFPHFHQALGEAEAHYNIGFLLYEEGHIGMAKQRFEQALAVNPNLQQAQAMLTEIESKNQRPNTTLIAERPVARMPNIQPSIRQTSAAIPARTPAMPVPAVRSLPTAQPAASATVRVQTLPLQETPAVKDIPDWQSQTTPAKQAVTPPPFVTKPAPKLITPPPAFRPTQQERWQHQEQETAAPDYLPPYRPNTQSQTQPAGINQTPAITDSQREQWENQAKARNAGH